jgi:hypothetical protein
MKQQPVAWQLRHPNVNDGEWYLVDQERYERATAGFERRCLYASPPASKPLTQDMVESCPYHGETLRGAFFDGWIKAEAAHGIKGEA